ncbi:MAG: hypothetical protein ACFFCS_20450 [Candidatus Hodarchaeota archaeon]
MDIETLKKQMPDLFEMVKKDVRKIIGRQRAGLSLGLVDMGISPSGFIGGMFFSGGTMILMNTTALNTLIDEINEKQEKPDDIVIAYVYHILMHEYIHSLGFLDEFTCREVTKHITKQLFSEDNPVYVMADRGIGHYFPDFTYAPAGYSFQPNPSEIELIEGFDRSSTWSYYS